MEAGPLLEALGNAKTARCDNASRFGKYLEIFYKVNSQTEHSQTNYEKNDFIFQDGLMSGARVTDYLLERSRIVSHAPEERNYHVFYEMLQG